MIDTEEKESEPSSVSSIPGLFSDEIVSAEQGTGSSVYKYRDFSHVNDEDIEIAEESPTPTPSSSSPTGGRTGNGESSIRVQKFPVKLYAILAQREFHEIITWMPHGRSWKVLKPGLFESLVMPLFFEYSNYHSFNRLVNAWSFRRIGSGPDRGSYYHELFLRGLPHLQKYMRRLPKTHRKLPMKKKDEPDFYSLDKTHRLPPLDAAPIPGADATKMAMQRSNNRNISGGASGSSSKSNTSNNKSRASASTFSHQNISRQTTGVIDGFHGQFDTSGPNGSHPTLSNSPIDRNGYESGGHANNGNNQATLVTPPHAAMQPSAASMQRGFPSMMACHPRGGANAAMLGGRGTFHLNGMDGMSGDGFVAEGFAHPDEFDLIAPYGAGAGMLNGGAGYGQSPAFMRRPVPIRMMPRMGQGRVRGTHGGTAAGGSRMMDQMQAGMGIGMGIGMTVSGGMPVGMSAMDDMCGPELYGHAGNGSGIAMAGMNGMGNMAMGMPPYDQTMNSPIDGLLTMPLPQQRQIPQALLHQGGGTVDEFLPARRTYMQHQLA